MSDNSVFVKCRALGRNIDHGYCMELEMAADDMLIWDGLEDIFTPEQIERCKNCPVRKDPQA